MDNNSEMYLKILAKGYRSVSEYTDKSRMRYVGPAATAIEIQALADCFGVDTFTYNGGKWFKYSCRSTRLSSEGIYMNHNENNHFDAVVCVQ